jgi:hypothetical protein
MTAVVKTDDAPKAEAKPDGTALLQASSLTFSEGENGRVKLEISGEPVRSYPAIYALPAFPLTAALQMVQLFVAKDDGSQGDMIGILENVDRLDAGALTLLKRLIRNSRMMPVITRINNVLDETHSFHWFVLTDRGAHDFFTGSPREAIQHTTSGQLVIEDLAGNHYILDKSRLDDTSRQFLEIAS